jgi:hypothetical protein
MDYTSYTLCLLIYLKGYGGDRGRLDSGPGAGHFGDGSQLFIWAQSSAMI